MRHVGVGFAWFLVFLGIAIAFSFDHILDVIEAFAK